ncbi:FtsX-like permease family protein [Plantactinospora sp. B5E13]|uniref:FtsX-like permease family protein n=1 Tax=Plantactinospora sp. B5E13 TaxID=3153758 RepID=UPI00325ED723
MFGFIWRHLRARLRRSLALLAGVLVATTGFVVLTNATTSAHLRLTEQVQYETRAAYDILVRPNGTQTTLETQRRVVRPNYLSGLYGGISLAQYEQIRQTPGVDVAAPVAMLGYTIHPMFAYFDLTDAVDPTADRQVIRVDPTFLGERGLSKTAAKPRYVYLTRNRLAYPMVEDGGFGADTLYTDGERYPLNACTNGYISPREIFPDGHTEPVCNTLAEATTTRTAPETDVSEVHAVRLLPDGRFENPPYNPTLPDSAEPAVDERLVLPVRWLVPFLLAAVEPEAEDKLVGLADAVVDGRPLTAQDVTVEDTLLGNTVQNLPVLAASRPYVDGTVSATYTRLRPDRVAGLQQTELLSTLGALQGGEPTGSGSVELVERYQEDIRTAIERETTLWGWLSPLVQAGPVDHDQLPDGSLRPRPTEGDPTVYRNDGSSTVLVPWLTGDLAFRSMRRLAVPDPNGPSLLEPMAWAPVGMFDPERLTDFSTLSEVPLETYAVPSAVGADQDSRDALGDRPMLPSGNPGGYLSSPPLLLTSLAGASKLLESRKDQQAAAPISAIRVRVAGVDGYTEGAEQQVRQVAAQLAERTGLDVDVTFGSSPAPQTVELPAGSFGRPELRLTEGWSSIGVASVIVQAVDRKSVVLFLLVLVVCTLFLANAVSAAVRDRRGELAVLACLGWPARRIAAAILGEVALIGLAAGLLALLLAAPLGAVLDVDVGWRRALLAVPVALLVAVVAGAGPALRAARAHPAAALRPAVTPVRRARRVRGVLGLAVANLVRVPGRALLGATALGIGVAALTVLAAINHAFRDTVLGSLLGDTVSATVRTTDLVAAIATVLLGAAAVADVLYLNIRDRSAELAALRATGWTEAALTRLAAYEGIGIGLLGAAVGGALGLAGAAVLIGDLTGGVLLTGAGTAAAGALVACLAALVPAALLRRIPTGQLLAEE